MSSISGPKQKTQRHDTANDHRGKDEGSGHYEQPADIIGAQGYYDGEEKWESQKHPQHLRLGQVLMHEEILAHSERADIHYGSSDQIALFERSERPSHDLTITPFNEFTRFTGNWHSFVATS
jgi:hypothetical protein